MKRLVCALAAICALTGCSGATKSASETPATHTQPAKKSQPPRQSPTPSSPTSTFATTGQYASIVAESQAKLGRDLNAQLAPMCDWTTPGQVDIRPGYVVCALRVLTIEFEGMSLRLELQNAASPSADTYIGPPPPEITTLVGSTQERVQSLIEASKAAGTCASKARPGCALKLFELYSAMTNMRAQFAAWAPYT